MSQDPKKLKPPTAPAAPVEMTLEEYIHNYGEKIGVPKQLRDSIFEQESNWRHFNPDGSVKTSPKGAKGVGQLMPPTARALGVKNIDDPIENAHGALKLQKRLYEKYLAAQGDPNEAALLAAAAYNAGEGAVDKYNGVPKYKETQNYVRKLAGQLKANPIQRGGAVPPAAPNVPQTPAPVPQMPPATVPLTVPTSATRLRRTTDTGPIGPTGPAAPVEATFTPGGAAVVAPGQKLQAPAQPPATTGAPMTMSPVSATLTPGEAYLTQVQPGELPAGRERLAMPVIQKRLEEAKRQQRQQQRQQQVEQARATMARVTPYDAAWHFGEPPASRLSGQAQRVLAQKVAADNQKREQARIAQYASGTVGRTDETLIRRPTLAEQNRNRAEAGLPPLKYNIPVDENAPAPYYQPTPGELPMNAPKTEVRPDEFRYRDQPAPPPSAATPTPTPAPTPAPTMTPQGLEVGGRAGEVQAPAAKAPAPPIEFTPEQVAGLKKLGLKDDEIEVIRRGGSVGQVTPNQEKIRRQLTKNLAPEVNAEMWKPRIVQDQYGSRQVMPSQQEIAAEVEKRVNALMAIPEIRNMPLAAFQEKTLGGELQNFWNSTPGQKARAVIRRLPFVGAGVDIGEAARIYSLSKKVRAGTAKPEERQEVANFQVEATRDGSPAYQIAEVLAQMPGFMVELAGTGGVAKIGGEIAEAGLKKAAKTAVGSAVERTVAGGIAKIERPLIKRAVQDAITVTSKLGKGMAGAVLQTPVARGGHIVAGTLERITPTFKFEDGRLTGAVSKEGESLPEAAARSYISELVEVASESGGEIFNTLNKSQSIQALRRGLRLAEAAPGNTDVAALMKAARYHGPWKEVAEERFADIGHTLNGEQEGILQGGLGQLGVEAVAFSIPDLMFRLVPGASRVIRQAKRGIDGQNRTMHDAIVEAMRENQEAWSRDTHEDGTPYTELDRRILQVSWDKLVEDYEGANWNENFPRPDLWLEKGLPPLQRTEEAQADGQVLMDYALGSPYTTNEQRQELLGLGKAPTQQQVTDILGRAPTPSEKPVAEEPVPEPEPIPEPAPVPEPEPVPEPKVTPPPPAPPPPVPEPTGPKRVRFDLRGVETEGEVIKEVPDADTGEMYYKIKVEGRDRPLIMPASDVTLVEPEKPKEPEKPTTSQDRDYGTVDKPNVSAISEHFAGELESGVSYPTITSARSWAGKELLGGTIEAGTPAAKALDEAIELAVVKTAERSVSAPRNRGDEESTYDRLVRLLDQQPTFGVRTSGSIADQAYSTPIPLAYIASRLAEITGSKTVYEPSAGNGALLIEANGTKITANEKNEARSKNLEEVFPGANVSTYDAADPEGRGPTPKSQDVVIANPPFGPDKRDGVPRVFHVSPSYRTTQIDHAIALKALTAMKDDGTAVLIVGGVKDPTEGYNSRDKRAFYVTLYGEYNVVDHFTVSGDLYKKQGAGWPVDVIVIKGRGKSARALPAVDTPRTYKSWSELKGVLNADYRELGAKRPQAPTGGGGAGPEGIGTKPGHVPEPTGPADTTDVGPGRGPGERPPVPPIGDVGERPDTTTGRPRGTGHQGGGGVTGPVAGPGTTTAPGPPQEAGEERPGGGRTDKPQQPRVVGDKPVSTGPKPGQVEKPTLSPEAQAAIDRLRKMRDARGGKSGVSGMPEPLDEDAVVGQAAIVGHELLGAGIRGQKEWSDQMVDLIGDWITEYLPDIWDTAASVHKRRGGETRDLGEWVEPTEEPEEPEVEKELPVDLTEQQVDYKPASKRGQPLNTKVPANMRLATEKALERLVEAVGDLDVYVTHELTYDSVEDMVGPPGNPRFGREQVDAIALAIYNIKNGSAMIIGDQTGIGKGRVVAAIIRWALLNGKIPVFVTEKPGLYADMARDLRDIGEPPLKILMTNADQTVAMNAELTDFLKTPPAPEHNAYLEGLMTKAEETGETTIGDYDAVFTTYNQMQTIDGQETTRQRFLRQVARDNVVIFDESHNAGGAEKTGRAAHAHQLDRALLARQIVGLAYGVFYSSATYAKRPSVMDLYSRTDMRLAAGTPQDLTTAITRGGVPLQQVVAAMLAEAGQMLRRERTFEGIRYDTVPAKVNQQAAEDSATTFRLIHLFDQAKRPAVRQLNQDAKNEGNAVVGDNATSLAGVTSTNFTSLMHNIVGQMLLMLKVQPMIDLARESLREPKEGEDKVVEKPFVTVANTMGAFLEDYVENFGIKQGDAVNLSFGDILHKYLERSREVRVKDPFGRVTVHRMTDEELGPVAVAAYERAENHLRGADWGNMPVSPIDYFKQKMHEAGIEDRGKPYLFGEITGRSETLDYSQEGAVIYRRRPGHESSVKGKQEAVAAFNSGALDGMIVNQSGSTGLSMHAGEKFKDQRPRHGIIGQPELNIDTHMQLLGRINRTGQVVLPRYSQLVADVPAENRPAAVLAKKMASLNANTTASKESAVKAKDVPDWMNDYGDEVVATIMENDPDLFALLGNPLGPSSKQGQMYERKGAIRIVSGRSGLLNLEQQRELYDLIDAEYAEYIARLDAMGENTLEATLMDLDAKLEARTPIFEGKGDSPFERAAYADRMDVKRVGKPYTSEQVMKLLHEAIEGRMLDPPRSFKSLQLLGQDMQQKLINDVVARTNDYIRETVDDYEDPVRAAAARVKLEEVKNRWVRVAGKLAVGQTLKLNTSQGITYGVVIKLEQKGTPKNPAALGTWKAHFALTDAARHLTMPLSRIHLPSDTVALDPDTGAVRGGVSIEYATEAQVFTIKPGQPLQTERVPVIEAFDHGQTVRRESRTILNGNLLAAFAQFPRGQIINYTDHDGNITQGILMARNFDVQRELDKQPVVFTTAEQVMRFLSTGMNRLVTSDDKELSLSVDSRGRYRMATAVARARGEKFWRRDGPIVAAAGQEFTKSGSRMILILRNAERMRAAIQAVLDEGHGLQTDTFKAEARRIVEPPAGAAGTADDLSAFGDAAEDLGGESESSQMSAYERFLYEADGVAPPDEFDLDQEDEDLFDLADRASARVTGIRNWDIRQNPESGYENVETSTNDVRKQFLKMFDALDHPTTIQFGRIRGKKSVLGQTYHRSLVIRVRAAMNIPVMTHEAGHALHAALYGQIGAATLKHFPNVVKNELVKLGKDLYGPKQPTGGYISEGFAEFMRYYLTTEEAPTRAPEMTKYLEGQIFQQFPAFAKALPKVKEKINEYRFQGAARRDAAQTETGKKKWDERIHGSIVQAQKFADDWIDEMSPWIRFVRRIEKLSGQELQGVANPYHLADAWRGASNGVMRYMFEDGMIDGNYRKVGPSFKQAVVGPIANLGKVKVLGKSYWPEDLFTAYVKALRAIERHSPYVLSGETSGGGGMFTVLNPEIDPRTRRPTGRLVPIPKEIKDPGQTLKDALAMKYEIEQAAPQIQLAAAAWYEWNDGFMRFIMDINPDLAPVLKRQMATSAYYVPLNRAFNELDRELNGGRGSGGVATTSGKLPGMVGSERAVKSPLNQFMMNSELMLSNAFKRRVLNQMMALERLPGVGKVIHSVPRDIQAHVVKLDQLRKELEKIGIDTGGARGDELLTYFTPMTLPEVGKDPIMAIFRGGKVVDWVYVPEDLYNSLSGMDIWRPSLTFNLLAGYWTRMFRLGTTGLRPSFSMFTNPLRDVFTWYAQSQVKTQNPIKRLSDYLHGMFAVAGWLIKHHRTVKAGGKTDELGVYYDLFRRFNVQMSQPLGHDMAITRHEIKRLFRPEGKEVLKHPIRRVLTATPIDFMRELLGFPESFPRIAEMRRKMIELGIDVNNIESVLQLGEMIETTLVGKQATVDFLPAGRIGKKANQAVPFFNPSVQGMRSFLRTFKRNPLIAILRGISLMIATLLLWRMNRDKEWYKKLKPVERYGFWNIEIPEWMSVTGRAEVFSIPRPQDWGSIWGSLPEALADAAYREDPEQLRELLPFLGETLTPSGLPVLLSAGIEQGTNWNEYFERPVISKGNLEKAPTEQRTEYTSELAIWIAEHLPNARVPYINVPINSPERIDALSRELFGGLGPDVLNVKRTAKTAGKAVRGLVSGEGANYEPADLPLIGRGFRRGGAEGGQSVLVDRYYRKLGQMVLNKKTKDGQLDRGEGPGETEDERIARLNMESAGLALVDLREMLRATDDVDEKREIQGYISDVAERALAGEIVYTPKKESKMSRVKRKRSEEKRERKALQRWVE